MAELFQPLVPAQPAPIDAMGTGIDPRMFGGQREDVNDRLAAMDRNVAAVEKQQSSFLPNALAIGALLTGNVGPMMQLEEQKRKTAIGRLAQPYMMEATRLSQQGDFEGAETVIATANSQFGQRAPEIMQMFKPVIDKISKDQTNWRDMKGVSTYLDEVVPDTAHPDVVGFRNFARKAIKNRTPISAELLGNLYQKAIPHMQMINNQALWQGALSGTVQGTPLPNVLSEKEVGGPVGDMLASQLGVSVPTVTDILNLKPGMAPIKLPDGSEVAPGSPEYQHVVSAYQATLPARASMAFGEKVPKEASVMSALQAAGATPFQLATGTYSSSSISDAIAADQARKVGVAEASALAVIRKDPLRIMAMGSVPLDPTTGLPIRTPQSIEDFKKKGIDPVVLPNDAFEKSYKPSLEALTALNNMEPLIQSLGNPQTYGERAKSWLNRYASEWAGVALAPGIVAGKHFEIVLNQAIEQAATRSNISHDDPLIKELKAYVTGKGNDPKQAREAVEVIRQRLSDRLYRETGEKSLSQPQIPGQTVPEPTATPQPEPTYQNKKGQPYQFQSPTSTGSSKKGTVQPYTAPAPLGGAATPTPAVPQSYVKPGTLR